MRALFCQNESIRRLPLDIDLLKNLQKKVDTKVILFNIIGGLEFVCYICMFL